MKNPVLKIRLRRLVHRSSMLLIAGAFALSGIASPRAASVRDVKSSNIDPSKVVVPESFETDVHKMITNWYLRKYAVLD